MRCIDTGAAAAALVCAIGLAACTPPAPPAPSPASQAMPAAGSVPTAAPPAPAAAPPATTVHPGARAQDALRLLVARRIVAAHPTATYETPAPDPLLAIPVLLIELDAQGRVRRIEVLRQPRQARDTTQIAIDAVRRAAPYGDITHLPRPWTFSESFLFDDERRFKPRSLER